MYTLSVFSRIAQSEYIKLEARQPKSHSLIPGRYKRFSLIHNVSIGSVAHPGPHTMGIVGCSRE
jgi:hypothetical protein